jgi:hypothetical protein
MASIASIRKAHPDKDDSDLRALLRRAILDEAQAKARVTAHAAAIERARDHLAAAEQAHAEAAAAVAQARAGEARNTAAALGSDRAPTSAGSLRAARAREQDAAGVRDVALEALERLKGADLAAVEADVPRAETAVLRAVNAVLEKNVQENIEAAKRCMAELVRARAVLHALCGAPYFEVPTAVLARAEREGPAAPTFAKAREIIGQTIPYADQGDLAVVQAWLGVRAALRASADAPLPE